LTATTAVSCAPNFEANTSDGVSLVESRFEITYTESVTESAGVLADSVINYLGSGYFSDTAKNDIARGIAERFETEGVAEEKALAVLSLYNNLSDKIAAINDELIALRDKYFGSSVMTDEKRRAYSAEADLIKQKYYGKDMLAEYYRTAAEGTKSIGVKASGDILYNTVLSAVSAVADSGKEIFTPEIYYYFKSKKDFFNNIELTINAIGDDNFVTLYAAALTAGSFYFSDSENGGAGVVYKFFSEKDVESISTEISDRISGLSLTDEIWEAIFSVIAEAVPSLSGSDVALLRLVDDDMFDFFGRNAHDFIINFCLLIKSVDFGALSDAATPMKNDDGKYYVNGKETDAADYAVEKIRKTVTGYKIFGGMSDETYTYFDTFARGLLAVAENNCGNLGIAVPDGYYDDIPDSSYEDALNALKDFGYDDTDGIDGTNADSYSEKISAFRKAVAGYFKIYAPKTVYYCENQGIL
jgi:hypothetical protein